MNGGKQDEGSAEKLLECFLNTAVILNDQYPRAHNTSASPIPLETILY